jgi:CBS domain containing-hemolysin-like protein
VGNQPIFLTIFWFLALILNAVAAAAKIALTASSLTRMVGEKSIPDQRVNQAIRLLTPKEGARARLSLQLGFSILRFLVLGLSMILFVRWEIQEGLILRVGTVFVIAAVLLALLEWIVEEQASQNPERTVDQLQGFIRTLVFLFYPITLLILAIYTPRKELEPSPAQVTEDELKNLVDAGQQEGIILQDERKMIYSIFQLGDTVAREVMVPRIDITALDANLPMDQAVNMILESGFSRVPIYEETIDNILGVLYARDLLRVSQDGESERTLKEVARPAYFVPESKKVIELLTEMQEQRVHMAVIVDEYGGVAGVVTMEDIVEEIVGEIHDEFDQSEELPYMKINEGEYVFQGRIDIDDFNEVMEVNLPNDDADSLGGFIYNRIGRVPSAGETINFDRLRLTVEQVIGRRIRKVRAQLLPEETPRGEEIDNGDR